MDTQDVMIKIQECVADLLADGSVDSGTVKQCLEKCARDLGADIAAGAFDEPALAPGEPAPAIAEGEGSPATEDSETAA